MSNEQRKLLRALGIIKDSDAPRNITTYDITHACGVAADKIVEFQKAQLDAREQLTKLCKLLSMNAGGPVDAILDEACQRLMIQPAVPTRAWYTHEAYDQLLEVCPEVNGDMIDKFDLLRHAAQVIHNRKQCIDGFNESREWDGVEPLFVGAIVEGGVVAAIGARVCIRDDLDGLHVALTVDTKPVNDAADRVAIEYLSTSGGDPRNMASHLRELVNLGLITLND